MIDKIKIYCPYCDQEYIIDRIQPGQKVECGSCERPFVVKKEDIIEIEQPRPIKQAASVSASVNAEKPKTEQRMNRKLKVTIISIAAVVAVVLSIFAIRELTMSKSDRIQRAVERAMSKGIEEFGKSFEKGDARSFIVVRLPDKITSDPLSMMYAKQIIKLNVIVLKMYPMFSDLIEDVVITSYDGAFVLDGVSVN